MNERQKNKIVLYTFTFFMILGWVLAASFYYSNEVDCQNRCYTYIDDNCPGLCLRDNNNTIPDLQWVIDDEETNQGR